MSNLSSGDRSWEFGIAALSEIVKSIVECLRLFTLFALLYRGWCRASIIKQSKATLNPICPCSFFNTELVIQIGISIRPFTRACHLSRMVGKNTFATVAALILYLGGSLIRRCSCLNRLGHTFRGGSSLLLSRRCITGLRSGVDFGTGWFNSGSSRACRGIALNTFHGEPIKDFFIR